MTNHPHKSLPIVAALLALGLVADATAQPAPTAPAIPALATRAAAGSPGSPKTSGVAGRVIGEKSPLASAGVYAFQLADLQLHKVTTDLQGNFLFQNLPAGLYKVIAHKAGFAAVVIPLTRTTAQAYQFLELQLLQDNPTNTVTPAKAGAPGAHGDDFWSLRASIPPDVLREIEQTSEAVETRFADDRKGATPLGALARFQTDIEAMKGVDNLTSGGEGQVAGGRLGIKGQLGDMQVGLRGHFWQFAPTPSFGGGGAGSASASSTAAVTSGQASSLSLDLENGPRSRVNVTSLTNRITARTNDGPVPVDFEHYRVSWSQTVGENSRSEIAAQYTSENNFHRQGSFDPAEIPGASRTWRVEGSYTTDLGPSSTFQSGIRYRALQYGISGPGGPGGPGGSSQPLSILPGQDSLDIFGRGGFRLQPAVLVEYGLYNTLADGSLAVRPQGGVVLRLGDLWQLQSSASRQAYERSVVTAPQFLPTLYQEADLCEEGGRACYELRLARKQGDDTFSLSAVDRTFGKTLRLYFSDDLFDRQESLYLVPGDRMPEVKLSVGHQILPGITTKFEASLANGGGGVFYPTPGQAYQNRVQYLVTSLDTRFKATSTGVFIAFHRLSQDLDPLSADSPRATPISLERLQLMLSQDLNILMDLAGDWTVQLNMELSRGSSPLASSASGRDEELRTRFLGGLAVKF
jgi:hypothetical protein